MKSEPESTAAASGSPSSPISAPEKRPWRVVLHMVVPLLIIQAVLVALEAGAADFGVSLRAMVYSLAILDLGILYKKERFLECPDFRRWCIVASILVTVLATILSPHIPWGFLVD